VQTRRTVQPGEEELNRESALATKYSAILNTKTMKTIDSSALFGGFSRTVLGKSFRSGCKLQGLDPAADGCDEMLVD
jgi:hypothetical protein